MDDNSELILAECEEKLDKAVGFLAEQLRGIRTGRATPTLIDSIKIEAYGAPTPLNQIAHISVPEARQLMVKPFDASLLKDIEKGIARSDLGLAPTSDGKVLRLTLPPLSKEQRTKLAAKAKELSETARVALRNARRDANKAADVALKANEITEDHNKELHDRIQDQLKAAESKVDEMLERKTEEIMTD